MCLKLGDFGLAINLREERAVTRAGTLFYTVSLLSLTMPACLPARMFPGLSAAAPCLC